jgi:hypothetical protein
MTEWFGNSLMLDELTVCIEHRQYFTFIHPGFDCRCQRRQLIIVGCRKLRIPYRFIRCHFFKGFFAGQRMCFEEERKLIKLYRARQGHGRSNLCDGLYQICVSLSYVCFHNFRSVEMWIAVSDAVLAQA